MIEPPIPQNEEQRIKTLYSLNILDTPPEERFNRITRITAQIFGMPVSTLSLIDTKRQWLKSCFGVPNGEIPRNVSFCGHTVAQKSPLIVTDTKNDPRFVDNPFVVGEPYIRFYAGVPLAGTDGSMLGSLCVTDSNPHTFDEKQIQTLCDLGAWAEIELNMHNLADALGERKKAAEQLQSQNLELERMNKMMVGRELKMVELKKEFEEYKRLHP